MYYTYKIANRVISIRSSCELRENDEEILFHTDEETADVRVTIEQCDVLPEPLGKCVERNQFTDVWMDGEVICQTYHHIRQTEPAALTCWKAGCDEVHVRTLAADSGNMTVLSKLWTVIDLPYHLAQLGVITLHASAIDAGGTAILFSAASGTGKSTQAELWRKYRGAVVCNGDKVAVDVKNGGGFAHGLPFAGTSGICTDYHLPIRAIVLLKQAKTNTIRRVNGVEALLALLSNCLGHKAIPSNRNALIGILTDLLAVTPVYELACTPDEEAVRTLENCLGIR